MVKRISSVIAVVALVLGMSTVAFAAPNVSSVESGVFVTDIDYTSGEKFDVGQAISEIYEDFAPGEKINIFLDPTKFVGTDISFTPQNGMTAKELTNAGIEYRISSGQNTHLIAAHSFKEKELNGKKVALIQLELVKDFSDTDAKAFNTTLTIYANKVKQQTIYISGEVSGDEVEIGAGDSYFSLGNGQVGVALDNISSIEIDAGEDVSLFTNLVKDRKYYAVAKIDPSNSDIKLMEDNEEIDTVYTLNTEGFLDNTEVKIKSADKFFVYNENGKLLGTTDDRLQLAKKYYLTTKEISLNISGNSDEKGDTTEPDLPVPEAGDGGSDAGETSGGGIPNTGIGPGPQIATLAVVVGLATIGVITFTSRKKQ